MIEKVKTIELQNGARRKEGEMRTSSTGFEHYSAGFAKGIGVVKYHYFGQTAP